MTPHDITTTGGGDGGEPVGADTADMRATADALSSTNDALGRIAGHAREAAFSGAMARTAIFSPGSAITAEASLVQAAAVVSGLTLRVDVLVVVLRARATLFDLADAGAEAIHVLVSMASVPLAIAVVGVVGTDRAAQILSAFPGITDLVTSGAVYWAVALGGGRPGAPRNYEDVLGLLQVLAWVGGRWHGGPVAIKQIQTPVHPAGANSVADILRGIDQVENGPAAPDDVSAVRIIRVNHPPDQPTWTVEIPGMDLDGEALDPSDPGANLSLMQRRDELTNAVLKAMKTAHIGAGERVLLSGHSQGGIVAMSLACDPGVRQSYNITNVLTAGSPVSRFDPPPGVHVLSVKHDQDPVPRLDMRADNPDRPNWVTVHRDLSDDAAVRKNPLEAHEGSRYAETGEQIDERPRLSADLQPFLGEDTEHTDYILQRKG